MSDMRDPYGNRPMADPYLRDPAIGGGPTWGWIVGIVVVALVVAFFAFGSNGWRTAESTDIAKPPVTTAPRTAPGPGASPMMVPPAERAPAPAPAPGR